MCICIISCSVNCSTKQQTEPVPSMSGTNDSSGTLRQSTRLKRKVSYTEMQSSDDTHWPLPLRLLKEQRTKPDTVNVKVDAKKLPSLLDKFSVANRCEY